jgi:hypothetical protein
MRTQDGLSSVAEARGDLEEFVAFYLVERYVPSMTADELDAAVVRLEGLPAGSARHLWTVLVGDEDTCLSVFEAADAEAVERANTGAGFPVDRVVRVIAFGTR